MVVFSFRPIFSLFIASFALAVNSSCSKGKLLGNQNDGTKKINPYSGTDTETNPSDISGAWLVMCRSEPTSDGAFLLQCRANDRSGIKYTKEIDFKIKLPDGSQLDPSQIKKNNTQDYFTFEATIRSPSPVLLEAKSADGIISISKSVSLGAVQDLPGLLVGVCGYTHTPLALGACDRYSSEIFKKSGSSQCPIGYNPTLISSRFQGNEGSGMNEWGSLTCSLTKDLIASDEMKVDMAKSPADYAVKGAAYGYGILNITNSVTPFVNSPMKSCDATSCVCYDGFDLKEVSSQVGRSDDGRFYTCVAKATGSKAAALQKGAVTDLGTYKGGDPTKKEEHQYHLDDQNRCQYGKKWAPISARGNNDDRNWRSVCLTE